VERVERERREPSRPAPRGYAPPKPVSDPFFEKPYEASASSDAAWDTKAAAPAPAPTRGMSPNIKPKRKVAALFGAKKSDDSSQAS
jgi:ATP-dependent RNA helicase RhlE